MMTRLIAMLALVPSLALAQDTARLVTRKASQDSVRRASRSAARKISLDSVRKLSPESTLRFSLFSARKLSRDSAGSVVYLSGVRTASQDTARRFILDSTRYNRWRIASNDPADVFAQNLYPPEMIMQNQGRLRITDAQRNAILGEINKLQATAAQVQWRVADESEKLNQLLERETVPEADVLAQAERMINFETVVKRSQLSMLIRIRNLLTAEQRAMLRDMRRRE